MAHSAGTARASPARSVPALARGHRRGPRRARLRGHADLVGAPRDRLRAAQPGRAARRRRRDRRVLARARAARPRARPPPSPLVAGGALAARHLVHRASAQGARRGRRDASARCRSRCSGGSAPTSTPPATRTARRARWRRPSGRSPGSTSTGSPRRTCTPRCAGLPFAFDDTFGNVTLGLVGVDPSNDPGRFEHGLTISLASAATICAAYVVWLALRPRDCAVSQHAADRRDARRLVERHGRDSLAYFALRRDKSYFFNEERTAFLAYRAVGGVALVSGDPVGDAGGRARPAGRLRAALPRPRLARRRARRRPRAPRRLACGRAAHDLRGRRGGRAPRALLARGPADPQGAAVGHAPAARPGTARASCGRAS